VTATRPSVTGLGAAAADRPGLAARRHLLPAGTDIDPFALAGDHGILWADGGRILVGLGVARQIALPGGLAGTEGIDKAQTDLRSIGCDDLAPPGTTPLRPVLAFGALPFDRTAPACLVVPGTLYCREPDGAEWVTTVSGRYDDGPAISGARLRDRLVATAAAHRVGDSRPVGTRVLPHSSDGAYEEAVARAVAAIGRRELSKVVLARRVDVALDRDPDVGSLLRRWCSLEPNCTLFSLPTTAGQFVGASPELLVERTADHVRSRPLAGTTDRFPDAGSMLPPALLDSAKDTEEHRFVVDAIGQALEPWCASLDVPDHPELVHLHNLTHLGTTVEGTLRHGDHRPLPGALHLAALLHPTPAVGGVPRAPALRLIEQLEDGPRGSYAGPVGYVDGEGDGRFVVGIRAMTVAGRIATLTAGVGVVAGSVPETERVEASLKFAAVFDALAPGVPFTTAGAADRLAEYT
jgi:isochorismate synthase